MRSTSNVVDISLNGVVADHGSSVASVSAGLDKVRWGGQVMALKRRTIPSRTEVMLHQSTMMHGCSKTKRQTCAVTYLLVLGARSNGSTNGL
jgi:hypothetical protein